MIIVKFISNQITAHLPEVMARRGIMAGVFLKIIRQMVKLLLFAHNVVAPKVNGFDIYQLLCINIKQHHLITYYAFIVFSISPDLYPKTFSAITTTTQSTTPEQTTMPSTTTGKLNRKTFFVAVYNFIFVYHL